MNNALRAGLVEELRDALHDAQGSPILCLLQQVDEDTVGVLVACCDQYLNAEFRAAASQLVEEGQVDTFMTSVSAQFAAAQPSASEVDAWRVIETGLAYELQTEAPAAQRLEDLVLASFSWLEEHLANPNPVRRNPVARLVLEEHLPDPEPSHRKPIAGLLAELGVQRHHERRTFMLEHAPARRHLIEFLCACDRLARELQASSMTGFTQWHWLATLLLLHSENFANVYKASARHEFRHGLDEQAYLAAHTVPEIEARMLEAPSSVFPVAYREPFGATDWCEHGIAPRSWFAGRLAVAALAAQARVLAAGGKPATGENAIAPLGSLLYELWRDRPSESYKEILYPKGEVRRKPEKASNVDPAENELRRRYGDASTELKAWKTFVETVSTREYDAAGAWRTKKGKHGSFGRAGLRISRFSLADHVLLRQVVSGLASGENRGFSDTVVVAIAGKLAALAHKKIREPIPKYPIGRDDAKQRNGASHQVWTMRDLAREVGVPPALEPALVVMAHGIYFKDGVRRDGFDWPAEPIHWTRLRSDSHLRDPEAVGPHLWLYGSLFQRHLDRVISEISETHPEAEVAQLWDTLARFIFLVPYHGSRDRLLDWKPDSAWQMQTALVLLCTGADLPGIDFDLDRHLARPVMVRGHQITLDNPLFNPPASGEEQ